MSLIDQAAIQLSKSITKMRRPPRDQIPWLLTDPVFADGIRLWMGADGNLRGFGPDGTKYQYAKTAVTAAAGSFPADPQPELIETVYTAVWAETFCDTHGVETGANLGYGDTPNHGYQTVLIGMPAAVGTDLASSTIDRVELYLANVAGFTDPVDIHLGVHKQPSAPATYMPYRVDAETVPVPRSGGYWYDLSPAFGRWFRDGSVAGFVIEQPFGLVYSGELSWADTQLRITYHK